MRLKQVVECGAAVVRAGLGQRVPIVVSWRLLNRCNLRCKYCYIPMRKTDELSADEVLTVLDELKRAGTQYLNFTGGEVLMFEGIERVLARASELGITHSVNSNGTYVPERIGIFGRGSTLTLSLDGDERAHDAARGRGTHKQVMAALDAARSAGVKVALTAVLSSANLSEVDWLLDVAARYRIKITFQPARLERLGSTLPDPITPPVDAYRRVLARLIDEKQRGNPWLMHSVTGLRHLAAFPARREISCQAGKLYFRIEPNGDLLACTDIERPPVVHNIRTNGLAYALARMTGTGCDECWGASRVEFNEAASLRPEAIVNLIRSR